MNSALLHLLHLTDPTLPIGSFSHSAGLETYVQQGIVKDKSTTYEFVLQMLQQSLLYNDAAFIVLTYKAALLKDFKAITEIDKECTAVKIPFEIKSASSKLGTRLLKIVQPHYQNELLNTYQKASQEKQIEGNYCIVFALSAFAMKISLEDALIGFYYNAAVGMVTNAVKLVPLSQQTGQEILFELQKTIIDLIEKTKQIDREQIGMCCTGFDIRSMQHERLYSRLYMS